MVIILFFLLVAVWAAVLLPSVLSARRETAVNGTRSPESPAYGAAGPRPADERRRVLARRRVTLLVLAGAALATLVAAIVTGSFPLLLFTLAVDVMLAIYVAILLQVKQRQQTAQYAGTSGYGTGEQPPVKAVGG